MNLFSIDRTTCRQDGHCAAVCPAGVIAFKKGSFPSPLAGADALCIGCGHCVAVCPTGSVTHRWMAPDACAPLSPEPEVSATACEDFLRRRRSIRAYRRERVARGQIVRLIQIARYAPTGHNAQCVRWRVVDDPRDLRRRAGVTADWMAWMVAEKPEVALPVHMDATLARWRNGEDVFLRGAPGLIVTHAAQNNPVAPAACTIALAYLDLAANSHGLGCCWAGYFQRAATMFAPMRTALALPEGQQSFGAMMIGYPRFRYHRSPTRNAPRISWQTEQDDTGRPDK